MNEPVDVSRAGPGEIADSPSPDDVFSMQLSDTNDENNGFVINWKTSEGAYLMAAEGSYASLDSRL